MSARKKYTVITFKVAPDTNPHLFVVHTMKKQRWQGKVITNLPDGDILITVVLSQVKDSQPDETLRKVPVLFLNNKYYHAYDADEMEDAKKRARHLANKEGNKVILKYLPLTEANALIKKEQQQVDKLKKIEQQRDQCYREMQQEYWTWGAYNMGWVESHNKLVAAYDKLHDEIYNYH